MKNISKLLLGLVALLALFHTAHAACDIASIAYTSCKPGYYLQNAACIRCPAGGQYVNGNDVYGTTPDYNTGGLSSCFLPVGNYINTGGSYALTGNCPY